MALFLLRGCRRLSSLNGCCQSLKHKPDTHTRWRKAHLSFLFSGNVVESVRPYSSEPKPNQKMVVVGIPNPFIWIRTRIYYFLIRAYFDSEFNIQEFTDGAKQAFCHVSKLLSQCHFDALDGLVAKDLIGKLEEKCSLLPLMYKTALSADPDEVMYSRPGDVGIYYDDKGRRFVSILMRFWYLTSAQLPDDTLEGTLIFQVALGEAETQSFKGSSQKEWHQTGPLRE
ncbi:m-AAA protease-interacting protein 1, mitochondrial isoform X2 [Nerophis ophidion]|uniref:m-AAA protease-interacting protein 1, mitochondrial isoform X2 n=1 Tax=Nerophis ophidion TaxID=159077 RepID=UPI002ADF05A2|nr:m-AAA protease-interacting protein 1, mitochondrial isoform X2 [Nerophis ophidion]